MHDFTDDFPLFSVDAAWHVPLHRYSWEVCVAARISDPSGFQRLLDSSGGH